MANSRARAFMQQKGMENRRDLLDQWEVLQEENVESQGWAGWGSLLGKGAAMLIPGLPLWGAMLAAGIGSRIGSEIGEHAAGHGGVRGAEAINPVGGGAELRRNIEVDAEDAYGQFGNEQNISALKDAVSAFSIGGGDLKQPIWAQLGDKSTTGIDMAGKVMPWSKDALLGRTLMQMFNKGGGQTSNQSSNILQPLDYVPEEEYGDIYG